MRLLFYTDVEVFGGHEVAVLDTIEGSAMVPGVSIGVAYCKRNKLLAGNLQARFRASRMVCGMQDIRSPLLIQTETRTWP